MYSFNNDYSEGAHPRILEAMMTVNLNQHPGYSLDEHTFYATKLIKTAVGRQDADIHFITGGTQTNLIVISAALRPHQAVVTAATGHINVHETGAIEATGHKVLTCSCPDGKLKPELIQHILDEHEDEHMVQPKMVYISNATELGTIYQKSELQAISNFCRQNDLLLFLDGARLGSALSSRSNDITLKDLAELTDLFYIGGTKNGALFGEALVICKDSLKQDFRFFIKQRGALLAKGWLLGLQFEALFQDDLYFELSAHANEMADKLKGLLTKYHYRLLTDSSTNLIFPILPNALITELEKNFMFSHHAKYDETHSVVRLVTSWATTGQSIDAFEKALEAF